MKATEQYFSVILFTGYVVVQFYPWFNFNFTVLFYVNIIMIMNIKQNKIKIEPRIKLSYKIYYCIQDGSNF